MKEFYPNIEYNKSKRRKFIVYFIIAMILLGGLLSVYIINDPKSLLTWVVAFFILALIALLPGVLRVYTTKNIPLLHIDDKTVTFGRKRTVELKDIVKAKVNVMVVTTSRLQPEIEEELKYVAANLEDDEYFGDVDIIIKGKNKEETLYSTVMDCVGALQALVDMGVKDYEINVFSGKYRVKSNYKLYKTKPDQPKDGDGIKLSKKDRIKQLL